MEANYVGPGWYWVENVQAPVYLRKDAKIYEYAGIKILAHIPRPAQRPIVDWSVMPAWAKWVCVNEDGYWYWSAGKPELTPDGWMSEWQEGAIPEQFAPKYTGDWSNSLVERPE